MTLAMTAALSDSLGVFCCGLLVGWISGMVTCLVLDAREGRRQARLRRIGGRNA